MITRTTRACLAAAVFSVLPSLVVAADIPDQGATMDQVRQAFGAPIYDLGAVGKPAITRWVYENFTVYFEGRRVIHAVRTQPLSGEAPAPVPAPQPAPAAQSTSAQPAPAAPAAAAAPSASPAPAPAPAPAPVATPPASSTAAAPVHPAPATVTPPPAPAATPATQNFRFDPATGRLILDGGDETAPATDAVKQEPAESEAAPSSASGGKAGNAMDGDLIFDPETGSFRPKP